MPPKNTPKNPTRERRAPRNPATEGLNSSEAYQRSCVIISALERRLLERTEELHAAKLEEIELRERARQLKADFQNLQKDRFDVISDFTRQHKATQDGLINRIAVLENTVSELRDQHELSTIALDETAREKDQIIAQKEREIVEQEGKMTQMTAEFETMLQDTLARMAERIQDGSIEATAAVDNAAGGSDSSSESGHEGGAPGSVGGADPAESSSGWLDTDV